jgi:hypothetical protein
LLINFSVTKFQQNLTFKLFLIHISQLHTWTDVRLAPFVLR